ncbi:MAG: hypothetical protein V2A76_17425 [Planctomycetota bacterium]
MQIANTETQVRSLPSRQHQSETQNPLRTPAGSARSNPEGTGVVEGGRLISDVVDVSEEGKELLSAVAPEEAIGRAAMKRPDLHNLEEGDSVFDKLKFFSRDPAGEVALLTHREIGIGGVTRVRLPKQVKHLDMVL